MNTGLNTSGKSATAPDSGRACRGSRLIRFTLIHPLLILIGLSSTVAAQTARFEGRLRSELYSWSEQNHDHIRPYLSLSSRYLIYQGAAQQLVSFNSYLRWTSDFSDKLPSDPRTSIYDAYLHFRNYPNKFDIKLGRQFVYTPLGAGSIDGARLTYQLSNKWEIDIFGGSSVSRIESDKVRTLSDFAMFGSRLQWRYSPKVTFGMHWMLKRAYGGVDYHRLGLDGRYRSGDMSFYGRATLDHQDLRPGELLGRGTYRHGKNYLSLELQYRQPHVRANSLFSLFKSETYQRMRIEARHRVWRDFEIVARGSLGLFSNKDSWRGSFGFRSRLFDLGYYYQSGFAGDNYGVTGYCFLPEYNGWRAYGNLSLNRYRVQEEQTERSDAHSAALGLQRDIGHRFIVLGECQYLSNAVTESDVRFLLRITKSFGIGRVNSGGGE